MDYHVFRLLSYSRLAVASNSLGFQKETYSPLLLVLDHSAYCTIKKQSPSILLKISHLCFQNSFQGTFLYVRLLN